MVQQLGSGSQSGEGPDTPELVCWKIWGGNGHVETPVAIPGLRGTLYSRPCEGSQGGDLYFLSACGSGALARMCIADVTGHGASVATYSAWLEEVFSKHIHRASPSRVLREVNRRATARGLEVMSTAVCLSYNSLNGQLAYCNAGHPPIRLCRAGHAAWEPLEAGKDSDTALTNMPLAVHDQTEYPVGRCRLAPGDRLLIHTDGLTEIQDRERRQLGESLWRSVASVGNDGTVDDVLDAIQAEVSRAQCDQVGESDDITVIVLEALPYQGSNRYALFVRNNFNRLADAIASR